MISSRHGLPLVAFLVTVVLAFLAGREALEIQAAAQIVNWLLVPAVWSAAVLAGSEVRVLRPATVAALVAAIPLAGWMQAGVLASLTAAGLVAGWAMTRHWRALPLLALSSLALLPSVALPMGGTSHPAAVREQLGLWREQYEAGLPADATPADREAAMATFDKLGEQTLGLVDRFWPSMILAGLVSQTVMFLLAGWGLARLAAPRPATPRLRALATWRAPFATVWVLIGGLVLSLAHRGAAGTVGWNLVALAASLLMLQGLGVQAWFVGRVLPPVGQVMFWVLGALFFAPALIGGGALIGLADQWMDLRRLHRPPRKNDET